MGQRNLLHSGRSATRPIHTPSISNSSTFHDVRLSDVNVRVCRTKKELETALDSRRRKQPISLDPTSTSNFGGWVGSWKYPKGIDARAILKSQLTRSWLVIPRHKKTSLLATCQRSFMRSLCKYVSFFHWWSGEAEIASHSQPVPPRLAVDHVGSVALVLVVVGRAQHISVLH